MLQIRKDSTQPREISSIWQDSTRMWERTQFLRLFVPWSHYIFMDNTNIESKGIKPLDSDTEEESSGLMIFALFLAIKQSNGTESNNETPPTEQTFITHYFAVTRWFPPVTASVPNLEHTRNRKNTLQRKPPHERLKEIVRWFFCWVRR